MWNEENSYFLSKKIYAAVYNPDTLEFIEVPQAKDEWNQIYKVLDKVILDK